MKVTYKPCDLSRADARAAVMAHRAKVGHVNAFTIALWLMLRSPLIEVSGERFSFTLGKCYMLLALLPMIPVLVNTRVRTWIARKQQTAAAMPQQSANDAKSPPRAEEFLLTLILDRHDEERLIGDLATQYAKKLKRYGAKKARLWYRVKVVREATPAMKKLGLPFAIAGVAKMLYGAAHHFIK